MYSFNKSVFSCLILFRPNLEQVCKLWPGVQIYRPLVLFFIFFNAWGVGRGEGKWKYFVICGNYMKFSGHNVLLEHSLINLLTAYGCFPVTTAELRSWNRDHHIAHETSNTDPPTFCRISLLMPSLEETFLLFDSLSIIQGWKRIEGKWQ